MGIPYHVMSLGLHQALSCDVSWSTSGLPILQVGGTCALLQEQHVALISAILLVSQSLVMQYATQLVSLYTGLSSTIVYADALFEAA